MNALLADPVRLAACVRVLLALAAAAGLAFNDQQSGAVVAGVVALVDVVHGELLRRKVTPVSPAKVDTAKPAA